MVILNFLLIIAVSAVFNEFFGFFINFRAFFLLLR